MNTIRLERLFLKNKKCFRLQLQFMWDIAMIDTLKSVPGCSWSHEHRCFYFENTPLNLSRIKQAFEGIAMVDSTALYQKPEVANKFAATRGEGNSTGAGKDGNVHPHKGNESEASQPVVAMAAQDHAETLKRSALRRFIYYLRDRRYSERTITTYIKAMRVFLSFYNGKPDDEITNEDIMVFNNQYIVARRLSASFQNQVINAIKLYYQVVHNRYIDTEIIRRPKRPKKLPNVLSLDEVASILKNVRNLKHRTMLALIYGCGLRRSELLDLRLTDVDQQRMMITVRNGKGQKDRMVPLSGQNLKMLKEYYLAYHPMQYLFEGQSGGRYSERSIQHIFKAALKQSGVRKPATLHWLRHSYATHLLENGTDIRIIQELLGHKSTKTTMIYTHVSQATLHQIKSPIERLNLSDDSHPFNS